jgi:phosphoglycolate phosphatase-like HAD superfamily hydrolase
MQLVLFDIDGTLTDTMAVDAECFLRAFADICGFIDIDSDWSRYSNATDAGILREVFESRFGYSPSPAERARFREHLVGLFCAAARQKPFAPVRGAPALLSRLSQTEGYRVALATGCWSDCARVKMASAGMHYDNYPAASADDSENRQAIIQIAAKRACHDTGEELDRMVYVGDGVWDASACRSLGIPFIGIGTGDEKEKLRAAGAADILPDFSDIDLFFKILDSQNHDRN